MVEYCISTGLTCLILNLAVICRACVLFYFGVVCCGVVVFVVTLFVVLFVVVFVVVLCLPVFRCWEF